MVTDVELFQMLGGNELKLIEAYIAHERCEQGTFILQQGEAAQYFYIIVSGSVEVLIQSDPQVRVAILSKDDFFGEMSCLTGEPVNASIRTREVTEVIRIDRAGFNQLMDLHPPLMRRMMDKLLGRISKSNELVYKENYRNKVLVSSMYGRERHAELLGQSEGMVHLKDMVKPLGKRHDPLLIVGERGVGKQFFAERIHYASFRQDGPIITVNALAFDAAQWREKQVAAQGGSIILTNGDQLPAPMLKEIIAQSQSSEHYRLMITSTADLSLPIQNIDIPPLRERIEDIPQLIKEYIRGKGLTNAEHAVSKAAIRHMMLYPFLDGNVKELYELIDKALVLSQGATVQPEHLRFGTRRKPGSRPKIGLALGAGAVRGTAHVGVLKILEREGIPIDYIAGSSVGALVGALYAAGISVEDMETFLPEVSWRQLVRLKWPKTGFLDNTPIAKWMKKFIGEQTVEQLNIPYAAVATDGGSGLPVIMNSGPVGPIVCASTAIPLIMKPVHYNDKMLWDGSIVHRVPVTLARSMGADIVIAVDVCLPTFTNGPLTNLLDSFMYSLDIMQERLAQDELEFADVVIKPTVNAGGFSFKNAPVFFEQGEQSTQAAIASIRHSMAAVMEGR